MQSKLFQTASAILPFRCLKPIQNVFGHSSASSEGTCGRWRIWAPSNRNCLSQRVLALFLQFPWCFGVLVFEKKILVWYNKMIKQIMWPAPKHFPLRCCFFILVELQGSPDLTRIPYQHLVPFPFKAKRHSLWAAWFRSNRTDSFRFEPLWWLQFGGWEINTAGWHVSFPPCTNIAKCG